MELPAVSERLGHSSVRVTATVYSHRLTGRDKEAAVRWDKFQKSHQQPERNNEMCDRKARKVLKTW
jgi:hypothetical protein